MTRWRALTLVALAGLIGVLPASEASHIGCGAVLGPGGTYFLDSDIIACAISPAVTLNAATLNMNGHTISCTGLPNSVGVGITRDGSLLYNGTVSGCGWGVLAEGSGHTIKSVIAVNNTAGFEIFNGQNNVLSFNTVKASNTGITVASNSSHNVLTANVADANGGPGGTGFNIRGDHNTLIDNVASQNSSHGVYIKGSFNLVTGTDARNNGAFAAGIAIDTSGTGNQVTGNAAKGSGVGIRVSGTSNSLSFNAAKGTDTDLVDDNIACDSNIWQSNSFTTDIAGLGPDGGPGVGCIQ